MRLRDPEHISIGGSSITLTLVLDIINLNTKFEMPSLTCFRYMIGGPQNLKVGDVTLTTPIWG